MNKQNMGEELPPSSKQMSARLPRLSTTLYEEYPAMSAAAHEAAVMDYGRACMALRQPAPFAVGDRVVTTDSFKREGTIKRIYQGQAKAYNVVGDSGEGGMYGAWELSATPAAPVSQHAAQEPIYSYCMKLVDGTYDNWRDCSRKHFEHVQKWPGNGFKVRTLYTTPQPLSAPAGSEQEKNAARYLFLRDNALMGYPSSEGSESKGAYLVITGYGYKDSKDTVDTAVDSALAAQQEQSK